MVTRSSVITTMLLAVVIAGAGVAEARQLPSAPLAATSQHRTMTVSADDTFPSTVPDGTTVYVRGTHPLPAGLVLRNSHIIGVGNARFIGSMPGARLPSSYPAPSLGEGMQVRQLPRGMRSASPVQAWDTHGTRLPAAEYSVSRNGTVLSSHRVGAVSRTFGWGILLGSGSSVQGITIERHSPSMGQASIGTLVGVRGVRISNVTIVDSGGIAVKVQGTATHVTRDVSISDVRIVNPRWMGVVATYVTNIVIRNTSVSSANRDHDYAISPQSGAVKLTKTHNASIIGMHATNIVGHGVWLDQSVYGATIRDSDIHASGSAVFCEISYGVKVYRTFLRSYGPRTAEGRSVLRLGSCQHFTGEHNVIVARGRRSVERYTDSRGKHIPTGEWCAQHPQRYGGRRTYAVDCAPGMGSDLDYSGRPTPGMTWTSGR